MHCGGQKFEKKCGNCQLLISVDLLHFIIPGSSYHPSGKYFLCVMLMYSFMGVFAQAPLSRAVVSVGPAPGKKKERNAEQWLEEKSHSCRRVRNRHRFVIHCVVQAIWQRYYTVWADGTRSLRLYLTAVPWLSHYKLWGEANGATDG